MNVNDTQIFGYHMYQTTFFVTTLLLRALNAILTGHYTAKSVFSSVTSFIFHHLNSLSSWGNVPLE